MLSLLLRRARATVPVLAGLALFAPVAGAQASRPSVLTIETMDFAFRAPTRAPAGLTTVRLVNRGTQLHHVQLNRLAPGRTVDDMLKAWKPGLPIPAFMTGDGGPTAALGGQTLEGQVVLRPGRYAIICWVPAPDGQPHLMKGMYGQLEVTGDSAVAAAATLPKADATIALLDYGFVVPPLARGPRTIRVENRGPQAHELVMVRLAPGRTMKDAAEWAERGQTGAAPGTMVGGVAALSPGQAGQFTVRLGPGEYALLCFVPDQKDGKGHPHVAYGMMRQLTIR